MEKQRKDTLEFKQ
jgi:hypothetical protein